MPRAAPSWALGSFHPSPGCSLSFQNLAEGAVCASCPAALGELPVPQSRGPVLFLVLGTVVSAEMTLSAELLALGIYGKGTQKRHLEGHK